MTELNYKFIAEKQEQEIKELKLIGKVRDILFNAVEVNFKTIAESERLALRRVGQVERQCRLLAEELEEARHALGMSQNLLDERRDEVESLNTTIRKFVDEVSLLAHESHMYRVKYQKAVAERGWWAKFKDFLQKPGKG